MHTKANASNGLMPHCGDKSGAIGRLFEQVYPARSVGVFLANTKYCPEDKPICFPCRSSL